MMLKIYEHYGYKKDFLTNSIKDIELLEVGKEYQKKVARKRGEDQLCFFIKRLDEKKHKIESSYMIGLDWVIPNKFSIYIQPKLNGKETEIDYLSMLFEALEESENLNHLEGLLHVDFDAPMIEIEQHQDKLTPFLLLEFLQIMKRIVRKGLKKSYYKVTENLNSRVKGKILVNATVKHNHTKQKMSYTVCQYQEFGYNSLENRILKKALVFVQSLLSSHSYAFVKNKAKTDFSSLIAYISPAFQHVNEEIDVRKLKSHKHNPLFKEYKQAIKLAKIILKKYGYNITQTSKKTCKTPPFWIDMSQLFELYTFKKLREIFPGSNVLTYHKIVNRVEPDFILNAGDLKMVIDAKYKPRYSESEILLADARQISGYTRLVKMYKEVKETDHSKVIDCLIIYSDQGSVNNQLTIESLKKEESKNYVQFYKTGLKLPELISK